MGLLMASNDYVLAKFAHLQKRLSQRGLTQEANRLMQSDKDQRRQAEKTEKQGGKPIFLRPSDVAGEYDFSRALTTTLGGIKRIITASDLKAFARNIKTLQQNYKGGISPQQVINLSLDIDIQRANKQITYAIPRSRKGDVVHFLVDASGEHGDMHHFVNVQFLGFDGVRLYPGKITHHRIKSQIVRGGVRFECDCGRYKYWYRYLNTIAGTNFGRQETAFPKIRNPNLTGVACKHILRTMQWIKSPQGIQYLYNQAKKAQDEDGRRQNLNKDELSQQLAEQLLITQDGRRANIRKSSTTSKTLHKMHNRAVLMAQTIKSHQPNTPAQRMSEHMAIALLQSLGYKVKK